jgi:alpha-glucosidase
MYQSWLANQVLLNLPLVLPLEILKTPWAKFNLDLKASLEPYYYSLAYNSSRTGEPLVAPMLYYFQDDPLARESDFETMVGPYLLVAAGVNPAMEILDFNLPVGRWYDLLNQDLIVKEKGDGTSSSNIKPQRGFPGDSKDKVRNISLPAKTKGFSVAPVLARAGSIIPMISDPSGPRRRRSVLVFPGDAPTSFVLYDDNGKDYDYQDGQYSTIVFELEPATAETPVRLTIKAKQGSFPEEDRNYQLWVEFVGLGNIGTASLDGENYKRANSEELLHSLEAGWFSLGDGRVIFKTPQMEPTQDHYIVLN